MKKLFTLFSSATALLSLVCFAPMEATYVVTDTVKADNLNLVLSSGNAENNGNLIGKDSVNINVNTFSGLGSIIAPNVMITVKKFEYIGTINCSGTCTIKAGQPFDASQFNAIGGGEVVITIDPTLLTAKSTVKTDVVPGYVKGRKVKKNVTLSD